MPLNIDTDLIQRAQKGDAHVIQALYEHHYLGVFRYLYYRVGDHQMAEDLTSEVFLRMLRFLGGFHPPSNTFTPWLYQIARNLAIDYYRKTGNYEHVQLDESLTDGTDRTHEAVERHLTNEMLRKALDHLTPDQRDVILMRFISGMPIAEVAASLHKTEDAVKGLQRRGLILLRGILDENEVHYDE